MEVKEIQFDAVKTLGVIKQENCTLLTVYNTEFSNISIDDMIEKAKASELTESEIKFMNDIFGIIRARTEFLNIYTNLTMVESAPKKTVVKTEAVKEGKLPRRYGKVQVMSDIKKNGGKMTEVQRMMLKVNDLKNMYSRLNTKTISNYFEATSDMTPEMCLNIMAGIEMLEKIVKKELNPKK